MSREARKEVKSVTQLISDDKIDAGELARHIKIVDGCKRVLDSSSDERLAGQGFTKEIVRSGSCSSASGSKLYRKDFLAVLRRRMASSSSRAVSFRSQDVSKKTGHLFCTPHGQKTQSNVRDRMMASKSTDVW